MIIQQKYIIITSIILIIILTLTLTIYFTYFHKKTGVSDLTAPSPTPSPTPTPTPSPTPTPTSPPNTPLNIDITPLTLKNILSSNFGFVYFNNISSNNIGDFKSCPDTDITCISNYFNIDEQQNLVFKLPQILSNPGTVDIPAKTLRSLIRTSDTKLSINLDTEYKISFNVKPMNAEYILTHVAIPGPGNILFMLSVQQDPIDKIYKYYLNYYKDLNSESVLIPLTNIDIDNFSSIIIVFKLNNNSGFIDISINNLNKSFKNINTSKYKNSSKNPTHSIRLGILTNKTTNSNPIKLLMNSIKINKLIS
jgi:hypothetical protein